MFTLAVAALVQGQGQGLQMRCSAMSRSGDLHHEFPCVPSQFSADIGAERLSFSLVSPPSESAHCGADFELEAGVGVLVKRGGCSFTAKVLASAKLGARVVVIANDRAGEPIPMGSAAGDELPEGALSLMVSQADGERLAAMLERGSLKFTIHPAPAEKMTGNAKTPPKKPANAATAKAAQKAAAMAVKKKAAADAKTTAKKAAKLAAKLAAKQQAAAAKQQASGTLQQKTAAGTGAAKPKAMQEVGGSVTLKFLESGSLGVRLESSAGDKHSTRVSGFAGKADPKGLLGQGQVQDHNRACDGGVCTLVSSGMFITHIDGVEALKDDMTFKNVMSHLKQRPITLTFAKEETPLSEPAASGQKIAGVAATSIKVLAFKRPAALQRLLASLTSANYTTKQSEISVDIWIDSPKGYGNGNSNDQENCDASESDINDLHKHVVAVARAWTWPHGAVNVHVRDKWVGLRKQWLGCDQSANPAGSIILEDDVEVSPWFFQWWHRTLATYGSRPDVAGITLQRAQVVKFTVPPTRHPNQPDY